MNWINIRTICFAILLATHAFGQRLTNVRLTEAGSVVLVRFTVTQGVDCGGFKILHSLDSVNFEVIGDEPGICGKLNEDEPRSFSHHQPVFGKRNYYRVQLYNQELSGIVAITVSTNSLTEWRVYPSPVQGLNNRLMFKWSNVESVESWVGGIYDRQGRRVRELKLRYQFPDQEIANTEGLESGVYKLWLTGGAYKINLDFIVQ